MEDWRYYKTLLALHRSGTIRGAAKALGVNHATVSRHITQIDNLYKNPVFQRVTGGYSATRLGLELIEAAEKIETITLSAERKSRAVNTDISGDITVSMPEPVAQFLLRDELALFAQANPKITLTIKTSVSLVNLDRSEADIVIRGDDNPPDHWVGRRLFPFYIAFYCEKIYWETTPPNERRWLGYSLHGKYPDWYNEPPYNIYPVNLWSDDIIWLHKAVMAGHGMVRNACYIGDSEPSLIRILDAEPVARQDFWILTHPDLKDAPPIKFLMKYLADAMLEKRDLIEGRLPRA